MSNQKVSRKVNNILTAIPFIPFNPKVPQPLYSTRV